MAKLEVTFLSIKGLNELVLVSPDAHAEVELFLSIVGDAVLGQVARELADCLKVAVRQ